MSTVTKLVADDIIAGKYWEDGAFKIVRYTNAWGGEAYGVCFEGDDPNKYCASPFVINPEVYWEILPGIYSEEMRHK